MEFKITATLDTPFIKSSIYPEMGGMTLLNFLQKEAQKTIVIYPLISENALINIDEGSLVLHRTAIPDLVPAVSYQSYSVDNIDEMMNPTSGIGFTSVVPFEIAEKSGLFTHETNKKIHLSRQLFSEFLVLWVNIRGEIKNDKIHVTDPASAQYLFHMSDFLDMWKREGYPESMGHGEDHYSYLEQQPPVNFRRDVGGQLQWQEKSQQAKDSTN